jgi:transcriptional regulator with XRE-family HTH domain
MSILELAEATGISPSHLGKIERNLISPSYRVVTAICRSLNLDILELNRKVKYSRELDDRLVAMLTSLETPPEVAQELLSLSLAARETLVKHLRCPR